MTAPIELKIGLASLVVMMVAAFFGAAGVYDESSRTNDFVYAKLLPGSALIIVGCIIESIFRYL